MVENVNKNELIKELAEFSHNSYLEIIKKLHLESFNQKANISYDKLSEEQKQIDKYIAEKIIDNKWLVKDILLFLLKVDLDKCYPCIETYEEIHDLNKLIEQINDHF